MSMWKLKPACKDYLWGGELLREKYHIESDCEPLAEAWVLSCHPDGISRLAEGEMEGMSLPEAAKQYDGNFFGTRCKAFAEFPMLVKLIDAAKDLSVQVHPDDDYAHRVEHQNGKAEMWVVLEAAPDAALYYGFARPVTKEEIERGLRENTLTDLLRRVPVKAGDVFYIPPGTVHAIGAGMVIAEIQQNSNVTYRLYDYGRLGGDGKPRPLHTEKALAVLNPAPVERNWNFGGHLGRHRCFTVDLLRNDVADCCDGGSFAALLGTAGEGELRCGGETKKLRAGECVFLPADAGDWHLSGEVTALCYYLSESIESIV